MPSRESFSGSVQALDGHDASGVSAIEDHDGRHAGDFVGIHAAAGERDSIEYEGKLAALGE